MKSAKLVFWTGITIFTATAASAQESGFTWGGLRRNRRGQQRRFRRPTAELTNTYIEAEAAFEAAITDRITLFGGLTLESVTDPIASRQFDDV